jgi:mannose-6-phosphate isomerase
MLVLAVHQPGGPWLHEAAGIIDALRAHYVDRETQSLRQYLGPDLQPLRGDAGLIRNAGHHLEWAWMLRRYIALSGDDGPRDLEHMFVAFARRAGVSPGLPPLYAYEVRPDGRAIDPSLRLWSQTEAIKVAAQDGPEGNDLTHARDLLAAAQRHFRPPGTRFWHEALSDNGTPVDTVSRTGMLFHIYVAAHELLRCGERHAAS